jgi:hypothetical protein
MQQLENDLDQAQENLLAANSKLEEKDKALQTVSSYLTFKNLNSYHTSRSKQQQKQKKSIWTTKTRISRKGYRNFF